MAYLGYEQIVATSTVKTVDDLSPVGEAGWAEIQAEDGPIRLTFDGATDPTASSGRVLLPTREPSVVSIEDVRSMRFVRGSGTDAKLNIHYFGGRSIDEIDPVMIWENGDEAEWENGELAYWETV